MCHEGAWSIITVHKIFRAPRYRRRCAIRNELDSNRKSFLYFEKGLFFIEERLREAEYRARGRKFSMGILSSRIQAISACDLYPRVLFDTYLIRIGITWGYNYEIRGIRDLAIRMQLEIGYFAMSSRVMYFAICAAVRCAKR